jgi:heparan-alpha-glucosaminide N-acetyltransferase
MDSVRLPRIASIDILRALTMMLMIFVNDLWNVRSIPDWLDHTAKNTNGMGLADVVFPAFLVIAGMSLPFAVDSRKRKGESNPLIFRHIAERSFALIVMGVFLVNGESINGNATGMSEDLYNTLACLSFIFIWNAFPPHVNKRLVFMLKAIGWIILFLLAWIYRGGEEDIHRFTTSWWGILGLIGWAYLLCALVFMFSREKLINMLLFWAACLLFSAAFHSGWIPGESFISRITAPVSHGAMPALVTTGVISSLIFVRISAKKDSKKLIITLLSLSAGLILGGFFARNFFIISKILATPTWVLVCSGITIAAFTFIYWLADIHHKTAWAEIIKPAGTNTLLCYLLPYFAYALIDLSGFSLPDVLLSGGIGLVKTFFFALLIVNVAGLLIKVNVRLKL